MLRRLSAVLAFCAGCTAFSGAPDPGGEAPGGEAGEGGASQGGSGQGGESGAGASAGKQQEGSGGVQAGAGGAGGAGAAGGAGGAGASGGGSGIGGSSGQGAGGSSGSSPGGASGSAGQAGAGTAGSGGSAAGGGQAGAAGTGGASNAGGSSGGGASGGSGGSGGAAGSGGTSGTGGGSGGSAPAECTKASDCPAPGDVCAVAVCNAGQCQVGESSATPAQVPGDCKMAMCVGGKTVTAYDQGDPPTPNGPCDVGSCTASGPQHTDDGSLCSPGQACSGGVCVCAPCPDGSITGLTSSDCKLPPTTTATSGKSSADTPKAIDGSASTEWLPVGGFGPGLVALLTVTLAAPIPMASVVILPDGAAAPDATMEVTLYGADATVLTTVPVDLTSAGPTVVPVPGGVSVSKLVVRANIAISGDPFPGVFEVAYRRCP